MDNVKKKKKTNSLGSGLASELSLKRQMTWDGGLASELNPLKQAKANNYSVYLKSVDKSF